MASKPDTKTNTPGDPAHFKFPTHVETSTLSVYVHETHSIRSLTPALEHCEHNPDTKRSTPGDRTQLQFHNHVQNEHSRISHSFQTPHARTKRAHLDIPLISSSPPTYKASPFGDPAHLNLPTHVKKENPWRSRSCQVPHRRRKRAPFVLLRSGRIIDQIMKL